MGQRPCRSLVLNPEFMLGRFLSFQNPDARNLIADQSNQNLWGVS